jgi:hypothetical protein
VSRLVGLDGSIDRETNPMVGDVEEPRGGARVVELSSNGLAVVE